MNTHTSQKAVILIIDDTPANIGVLANYLTDAGYGISVAEEGEGGIEQAKLAEPDIILLDVMMPGIDGFETCRRLKENKGTKHIPVIFMTALVDTVDKVKGFEVGAVDYITKPIQQEEVLARIETHLTIQKLKRKLQDKNKELMLINENLEKLVDEKTRKLIKQEKSAIIGRLTQGMVHNLKSPLTVIFMSCKLIRERAEEISETFIIDRSGMILDATKRMDQMMDNLMIKSRKDHQIEEEPIDINDLLKQELELLEANPRFKYEVEKEFVFESAFPFLPLVYSDISQVFHNLVNNALDAMWGMKTQKITVATRQNENSVFIDFKDTGCGITPDKLEVIFDPFYTSKPSEGKEQENEPTGTGLGLHTCLELLKPFGGVIKVKSEEGKGSVFTVSLPKKR